MGKRYRHWTEEEEEALCAGVAKHGLGKWKDILNDPKFGRSLLNRSNNDLKDKWRNLAYGGSKDKQKLPKLESKVATSQPAATPDSPAATTQIGDASLNAAVEEQPSSDSRDGKKDILRNRFIVIKDTQLLTKKMKAQTKVKNPQMTKKQDKIGKSMVRLTYRSPLKKTCPMKKTLSIQKALTSANKKQFFEKSRKVLQNCQRTSYSKEVVVRQFHGKKEKSMQNASLKGSKEEWNLEDKEINFNIEFESDESKNEDVETMVIREECESKSEHANTNEVQLAKEGSPNKNTRGPSTCKHIFAQRLEERDTVTINEKGQPVGDIRICNGFNRFLRSIARNPMFVPLTIENWTKFPQKQKDKLWKYVNDKYIVSDGAKKRVLNIIATLWRGYKSRVKKRFLTKYKTFEERVQNRPNNIPLAHFIALLQYWEKQEFKDISRKNKENHKQLRNAHRVGLKSYADELMAREEASSIEIFLKTQRSRGTEELDEDTVEKIAQLREIPLKVQENPEHEKGLVEAMGKHRASRKHFLGRERALKGNKKNPQGNDNNVVKNLEDKLKRTVYAFHSAFTLLLQSNPNLVIPLELHDLLHSPSQEKASTSTRNLESPQNKRRNLAYKRYKDEQKLPKVESNKAATSQPAATPDSPAATTQTSRASSIAATEAQPASDSRDGKKASQDEIPQTSTDGQKSKKSIPREGLAKKKKSNLREGPPKQVKAKPLPFGARKAQAVMAMGTVRRSARIICSRFRTIPSNPDDPIVID